MARSTASLFLDLSGLVRAGPREEQWCRAYGRMRGRATFSVVPAHAVAELHLKPSYSAKAEYPVRRSFSVRSLAPRNTGSPAFVGDDDRRCGISTFIKHTLPHSRRAMRPSCAGIFRPKKGVGNAGCPMHPQPRARSVESTRVSHHGRTGITRHSLTRRVLQIFFF